ncbi:hypothetical protein LSTR_LSTR012398 [Laodelphax striatellus]|uniref:Uncharacterized protein n=1 Tax=Laodelphax striatellus TaxID=195883 RepID=A0A482WTW7_LAOST|nr:hypothetical protein LSTR_LSTR012398 [Laodelphax striatellus]
MFLSQAKSNGVDTNKILQETVSENGSGTDQLANIEIVSRFTSTLCSREASIRATALEAMEKSIFQWMERSKDVDDSKISNGNITNGDNAHVDYKSMIIMHIPALLRLSVSCPFWDVRDKCQQLIDSIREKAGIEIPFHHSSVGASFFIPQEDNSNEVNDLQQYLGGRENDRSLLSPMLEAYAVRRSIAAQDF